MMAGAPSNLKPLLQRNCTRRPDHKMNISPFSGASGREHPASRISPAAKPNNNNNNTLVNGRIVKTNPDKNNSIQHFAQSSREHRRDRHFSCSSRELLNLEPIQKYSSRVRLSVRLHFSTAAILPCAPSHFLYMSIVMDITDLVTG
jgi:hypothetical protein